ncbi:hypothetical protein E2320_006457, partial [Naja naja]
DEEATPSPPPTGRSAVRPSGAVRRGRALPQLPTPGQCQHGVLAAERRALRSTMPVQAAQWTEFLSCPICYNEFDENVHKPISLGCSHTVCQSCLSKLHRKACPFDQTAIHTDIDVLPVNFALLQLVGAQVPDRQALKLSNHAEGKHYEVAKKCVEDLALYLKPLSGSKGVASLNQSTLSRPMQRKLVTLVNCQLVEEEGRIRAMRAARSLGERTVTELILQHQNPQQLSANLWAAVRARGCQFLGPAMQEEALKLVLLALEDGSALSRKVLVLFVVQRLEPRFPQASKTSIGHVVTKRDEDSSLMQLKEEFRSYEALRREHDAQIVHIALEAGLRISPEQWSSLLYGDLAHKSHMHLCRLQSPESFAKSVQELTIVLQRTGDPANLNRLRPHLEFLANIDPNPDAASPTWEQLENATVAVKTVVRGLVDFIQNHSRKGPEMPQPQPNSKYKTSLCRDLRQQGGCPRGTNCTFAHSQEELEKYRLRNKKIGAAPVRPFPLLGKASISSPIPATVGNVLPIIGNMDPVGKAASSTNRRYYPGPPAVPAAVPPCLPRFVRSSNISESPLPPASLQYSEHYSTFPARDRLTTAYQQAQPQPYGPVPPVPSGMYAPVYDSRRIWRPLMYQRDDLIRSNSFPPMEVTHPSVYHNFLRERYGSLDSYCSVPCQVPAEQRAMAWAREPCGHLKPAYEDPLRKKAEQWAPCHIPKVPLVATSTLPAATPSPSSPSPLFCVDFSSEFSENSSGSSDTRYEDGQLCQYSPWSCSTLSSCISADLDSGEPKRPLAHLFETQRKAKEEDPIIPFSDGPIISKWGAISRSSRTGYHTTDPVQATASQGSTTKPISMSDYIPSISSVDLRWSCYVSDSTSSAPFIERDQFVAPEESASQKHSSTGVLLSTELQQAKSNSVLLQREANALAMQQKWDSLSEGSALTLKLLGKEMELRNGQADSPENSTGTKSNRDIELELSSLDTDEAEGQGEQMEEVLGLQLGTNNQHDNLFGGSALENGHPVEQPPVDARQAKRPLLHEELALLEKRKGVLPAASCFSQPTESPAGSRISLPIMTTSASVHSLLLKTAHGLVEGQNDFLRPIANGKMVNT